MEKHKEQGYFHEASFIDQEGNPRTSRIPVVQELARQGINHVPKRFIRVHPENTIEPSNIQDIPNTLPLINVAKLRAGSEAEGRAQELAKLGSGAREWGLFLVTEHGIRWRDLVSVKEVVKGFFGLSFEDKKRSVGSCASIDNMGYGRNFVKSEDQPLDWIDRLTMKAALQGGDEAEVLNVWPQNPPDFRQVIEKYVQEARKVLEELLQALAESLSLNRNAFLKYFNPETSEINVRVNYYPPCPRPDLTLGLTPHTDASALTLLIQFEASGGLQMLKDNQWLTLPWPNDSLLVNLGDLLEIMSNGRLKSPWHRVLTQMDVERYSIALFYNPPASAEIEPEPLEDDSIEEGGFRRVVVGDYLQHFYRISPTEEKQAIMYAKFNKEVNN